MGTLKGSPGGLSSVAFSPDGKKLYSTGGDAKIKMWDIATGEDTAEFLGHTSDVSSLAFTADGRSLVSGGRDGAIRFR